MKQRVMITDLTRMGGDRVCVAGVTPDGRCVRPCLSYDNLTEPWLWDGQHLVVRPFAVVELDLLTHKPSAPHTEDWLINPAHRVLIGAASERERKDALMAMLDPGVEAIFGAEVHFRIFNGCRTTCWVRAGEGTRSLGTVGPVTIWQVDYALNQRGRWDFRLSFSDQSNEAYALAVTDLAFRELLTARREADGMSPTRAAADLGRVLRGAEVYLRIGLARAWKERPGECYLQVTGVYSVPDYLGGRSFADVWTAP